ncbi:MAG: tyrosine--tRNA ligase [Planctomycetota bacterium]
MTSARGFAPVDEQLERIRRGVVDLVGEDELRRKLEQSRASGRRLRVKFGIDPSSPDIHVGHTVVLRKLRTFQELGHLPVVIWGTATARVGDPTGKDKTRPQLDKAQVLDNLRTYKAQITKVLDIDDAEHRENGEWFDEMSFMDGVRLLSRMTVARAIERDSFANRIQKGLPVSLHEIVYPLMQGWDSVEVRADVELGGSDQLFNLLVGRDLQAQEGQEPQVCLTLPIIEGLDGVQKMSKSLGNTIGIHDEPADMFGKVMSVPDALMAKYFTLLTDVGEAEVEALLAGHPREAKARLGREIVGWLHGPEAAEAASAEFDRVFKDKDRPSEIDEFTVPGDELREGKALVVRAAVLAGLCASSSEARRLVQGGGLKLDDEPVADPRAVVGPGRYLVQAGKRRFCWVVDLSGVAALPGAEGVDSEGGIMPGRHPASSGPLPGGQDAQARSHRLLGQSRPRHRRLLRRPGHDLLGPATGSPSARPSRSPPTAPTSGPGPRRSPRAAPTRSSSTSTRTAEWTQENKCFRCWSRIYRQPSARRGRHFLKAGDGVYLEATNGWTWSLGRAGKAFGSFKYQ